MRLRFDQVFNVVGDQIQPKSKVKIGGVTMAPGVSMRTGVIVSGIDLTQHVGEDLDVEQHPDGTIEIKGIFQ